MPCRTKPTCLMQFPIEHTIEEVERWLASGDEAALDAAYQRLCSEFDDIADRTEPQAIYMQFRAMATIVKCHIYAGNEDEMMKAEWGMIAAFDELKDTDILSRPQLLATLKVLREVIHEVNVYFKSHGVPMPEFTAEETPHATADEPIVRPAAAPHACFLCGKEEATCKGSHLAPNFLIQPFFSYDGTSARGKELVNESVLGGLQREKKWGRRVPSEVIDEKFGVVDEEEKTSIKVDALTRDDVFCNRCEKRFGYIETAYAPYFQGKKPSVAPVVSYLFWLGVFWRLSVADMCLWLSPDDAEAVRAILDGCMPDDAKAAARLLPGEGMGKFGYSILHCSDLKGELSGVIGNHARKSPYKLLIGNYVIILYSDRDNAPSAFPVNDFTKQELVVEIPFIEFWKQKRDILDSAQRMESKHFSRERRQLTDLVQADHLVEAPSIFGREEAKGLYEQVVRGNARYGYTVPGSIGKLMLYAEKHPFETQEERWEGIERELGYTREEAQEMLDYWGRHGIYRVSSAERTERHQRRKQRSRKKQARKRKR